MKNQNRKFWAALLVMCTFIAGNFGAFAKDSKSSQVKSKIIGDKVLQVSVGDVVLFDYNFRPETEDRYCPRPFMHPVRTLSGDVLTNSRPIDHPWHNGLSLTLTSVDGMNFWGGPTFLKETGKYQEQPNFGKQVHREWIKNQDKNNASWIEIVDWIGPNGEKVFEETRTITVRDVNVETGMWRLVWESKLKNLTGKTLSMNSYCSGQGLNGSGYTGLFMRMSRGYTLMLPAYNGHIPQAERDYTACHDGTNIPKTGGDINGWKSTRMAHQGIFDTSLKGTLLLCEDLTENPAWELHWFYRPQMPCIAWSTAFYKPLEIAKDATITFRHAMGIVEGFYNMQEAEKLWMKP